MITEKNWKKRRSSIYGDQFTVINLRPINSKFTQVDSKAKKNDDEVCFLSLPIGSRPHSQ
jgi:hypothetical protein